MDTNAVIAATDSEMLREELAARQDREGKSVERLQHLADKAEQKKMQEFFKNR